MFVCMFFTCECTLVLGALEPVHTRCGGLGVMSELWLFHLIHWDGLCSADPELTDKAILDSQLAPGESWSQLSEAGLTRIATSTT